MGHTEERKAELTSFIDGIIQSGVLSQKTFERLRGRMVFFEGYAFGRVSGASIRFLAKQCDLQPMGRPINQDMMKALDWLKVRLDCATPLLVQPAVLDRWFVFTDGACEPELGWGGIGAVLVSPNGAKLQYFGSVVPKVLMEYLLMRSETPIYHHEIAPLVVAAQAWAKLIAGAQVVLYFAAMTCL